MHGLAQAHEIFLVTESNAHCLTSKKICYVSIHSETRIQYPREGKQEYETM